MLLILMHVQNLFKITSQDIEQKRSSDVIQLCNELMKMDV